MRTSGSVKGGDVDDVLCVRVLRKELERWEIDGVLREMAFGRPELYRFIAARVRIRMLSSSHFGVLTTRVASEATFLPFPCSCSLALFTHKV